VKVLLVGDGARENAYAQALTRSRREPKIYAIMKTNNPGVAKICERSGGKTFLGNLLDSAFIAAKALELSVEVVFIGPEEPQFQGVSDAVEDQGITCLGARKAGAEIEKSKVFMRNLMLKYDIPGRLAFKAFKTREEALTYLKDLRGSIVIKPTRQVGGKGVKVIGDTEEYLSMEKKRIEIDHTSQIFDQYMKDYSDVEDKVLFEEKAFGPEYTVQTFTDGRTTLAMPMVQDNKQAYEMDTGPMTGGMGSISNKEAILPFLREDEYKDSVKIIERVTKAIEKENKQRYRGIISGQMMLTANGPTVIEFYSRLGDPEAVNVLSTLNTDLIDIAEAIASEKLHKIRLEFEEKATVVKCVAPKGYPDARNLAKGHPVSVDEEAIKGIGCKVLYGSIDLKPEGVMTTAGSRLCEILAMAKTIPEASRLAEKAVAEVKLLDGWKLYHRPDIGSERLLQSKIEQANLVRSINQYRRNTGTICEETKWIPGRGIVKERY
jgi:phosphoribosylamine---glycine ligase